MRRLWLVILFVAAVLAALGQTPAPAAFHFVLLGDRTGEAQPGVWEQVWKQAAAENPAFVLGVGDTIEGGDDATAESEWREAKRTLASYAGIPLYLAPGNHDIWSPASEELFEKYTGHPPHYSFDFGGAHFTVLDNSRSDDLSAGEMAFLASDLAQHQAQLLHATLDGVTYFCAPSAGGHLRASGKYDDGWFFGYTVVTVDGSNVKFEIRNLDGRKTGLADWGLLGLKPSAK
jgi:hypothetical protein